jgi:hypothetical protein
MADAGAADGLSGSTHSVSKGTERALGHLTGGQKLSWNEVRVRAARFAEEWKDAHYEKGETQTFYDEFFAIFGVLRRQVASFEEPVKKLGDKQGFIDLFWKGVLLVEQKSAGRNLVKAKQQAFDYFPNLKPCELPRYILLSDFQSFELYDLDEGEEVKFALNELPQHVEAFGFILGIQKVSFKDQDPVNIEASELMGKLHDALKASGYAGHQLERFLVRLLFCLFADDTGIFEPRGILLELLSNRTREDGSDTGLWLHMLFQVLNQPHEVRPKTLDADLARFPYVNGQLFAEQLETPAFDSSMRQLLIEVCEFNWDAISPAIFGSLFQSVMDKAQRRAQGAHYTTEKNILKVIQPLFLDTLRQEFEVIKARRDNKRQIMLEAFHEKLSNLRFFDPACGCGNFLIIAYRELRALEIEVLKELKPAEFYSMDVSYLSRLDVDQFYGIELDEFPARIAEVALWMMDHIMNTRLSLAFGQMFARIPLKKSPHIYNGDALEMDWAEVLPSEQCSYVFGNPPFIGAKFQSPEQREQVRRIAQLGGSGGTLDYVTAWFLKAGEYVQHSPAAIAFVATNSITQGEQVAQLWPLLFEKYGLEIIFAHRTFAWGSDARGKAHVHVVIIGLNRRERMPTHARLFSYPDIKGEPAYLFDGSQMKNPHLVVREANMPLDSRLPKLIIGSKPIDGGHYIFSGEEKTAFLQAEPEAAPLFRPFVGSREFLNGGDRWILCFAGVSPEMLRQLPKVRERISAVREFRLKSNSKTTQTLAAQPLLYHVNVVLEAPYLVIPEVSSERREYVPIGWLEPPIIPSNLVRIIENATRPLFALLTSAMHMSWMRHIGGRLESRYRYSIGLVYNTFSLPPVSPEKLKTLEPLADAVLIARAAHGNAALADLYDPDLMPAELRRAHLALDKAVDRLYRPSGFASEWERVEWLFSLYEKMVDPMFVRMKRSSLTRKAA